jgi:hypothetical protein
VWSVFADGTVWHYLGGELLSMDKLPPTSLRQPGVTIYLGALLYSGAPFDKVLRANQDASFRGEADEVMLFSRGLNSSEAQALYLLPADTSQPPVPRLVLHYTFDAGGCASRPQDVYAGLLGESCTFTGDGVVKNHGAAGSDYDLLNGHVDDKFGFGRTFGDLAGGDRRWQFSRAGAAPSQVPWGGLVPGSWPLRSALPLVLQVAAGALVRVPLAEQFGARAVAGLVLGGELIGVARFARGSDSSALAAGDALAGEPFIVLRTPDDMNRPLWFSLLEPVGGGGDASARVALEVHLWPPMPPEPGPAVRLAGGVLGVEAQQDTAHFINVGSEFTSLSGEAFNLSVTSLPASGEVRSSAGDLLSDGARVGPRGLAVLYVPPPGFWGTDSFRVVLVSLLDERRALELEVAVHVRRTDGLPNASHAQAAVREDDADGIELLLPGSDALEKYGLTFCVTSLPRLGKLYAEDGESGEPGGMRRRAVDQAFNRFDMGAPIRQYASRVLRVSSFDENVGLDLHPLAVLGPPTCRSLGKPSQYCEPVARKDELAAVGQLVYVHNFYGARVVAVRPEEGVIDVDMLDTFRLEANGTLSPCLQDPETGRCSAELLRTPNATSFTAGLTAGNRTTFGLLRVPPEQTDNTVGGAWYTVERGLVASKVMEPGSRHAAALYGAQFLWGPLNHSETYRSDPAEASRPYTEFIEVGFDAAVFPVAVTIGSPRGGGAVVNVLARDLSSGRWQSMYQGAAQREKGARTNGLGDYFTFDERLCRAPFKTDALRIELDTTEETGIADWSAIDYIELIGSPELQPGVLRSGGSGSSATRRRLLYVPDPDQSGEDSFSFVTSDCLGDWQRESEATPATVAIASAQDAPLITFSPQQPALLCGLDDRVDVLVSTVELDGDVVSLQLLAAPAVGEVAIQPLVPAAPVSELAPGAGVVTAVFAAANATFRVDCGVLVESVTDVTLTVAAVDSAGLRSTVQIPLRVLKEDLSRISSSVRAVCVAMLALNLAGCLLALAWTWSYRASRVVRASQGKFLVLFVAGTAVCSLTIPLLLVEDDEDKDPARATLACNAAVWTYCVGSMLTYAALLVKLEKIRRMLDINFAMDMRNGTKSQKVRTNRLVSPSRMLSVVAALVGVDVCLCAAILVWTPLQYSRGVVFEDAPTGYPIRSRGTCRSGDAGIIGGLVVLYHLGMLFYLAVVCYRCRHVHSMLAEGKYVSLVIYSSLQIFIVCVPVLLLGSGVSEDTFALLRSGFLFINSFSGLALVFGPKIFARAEFETMSEAAILGIAAKDGAPAAVAAFEAGRGKKVAPAPLSAAPTAVLASR